MNYFNIAVKYIEQCAGLDLNMTTCLASSTMDAFTARGAASSEPSHDDDYHGQSSGQRFLQTSSDDDDNECIPPELDELTMRYMIGESKQQCMSNGLVISDQEFEDTVGDFMDFFGAQNCWVALCEEESNPSAIFLKIMFEEIAQCAGAELDFNPCLLDQIFEIIFSSDDPDGTFDGVRRKLEHSLGSPGKSDEPSDPCADQPNDAELYFAVSLMLAGAQEQCMEMGETFEAGEVDKAGSELFKLFSAQQCWGTPSDCNDHHDEHHNDGHHSSYLEFIEESTTWMLGQCADVEEISCVFSRSIEVIHGMKLRVRLGGGHSDHRNIAQESESSICTPPTVHEYDIEEIAYHAIEHCFEAGALVLGHHYNQAVHDLKNLTARPDCWEDLCEPEVKDIIVDEWMHTCASTDLKFLTAPGPYKISGDVSLDSDRLRCMVNYISQKWEPNENWACSLPHLGHDVCGSNPTKHGIGKEAYINCGGEVETHSPSQSPSMHFSMSFAYNDGYDWAAQYEPEMSFSMSLDNPGHQLEMSLYIEEVCSLIGALNADIAQHCLQPVCDIVLEDAFTDFDDNDTDGTTMPTVAMTLPPTDMEEIPTPSPSITTSPPTSTSASPTTLATTLVPTAEITSLPTLKPTPFPTRQPTSSPTILTPSPTVQEFGSVEVSFEVGVTLEGIDMSDLDITALDEVVDLLETVLGNMLPEGAIVRLLKVGGFSVTRRLLRFLEEDGSGVDVEFEIIMRQSCSSAKCDDSESDEIAATLYDDVTSDLEAKVASGELTTSIQEEAEAAGVSEMSNVTINASTLQVGQATITVKEAKEDKSPDDPTDDVDSASSRHGHGVALSIMAGFVSMIFLLHT